MEGSLDEEEMVGVVPEKNTMEGEVALKDFIIFHNEFRADIKTGDDLSKIPELYRENLKTEGVI